ncbi:MAG: polysaccharide deacetylase family protein [Fretibacterium sp.]|nr:polysaccharide deacetylase family protein [Fretibacterium sp.]
MKDLMSLFYRKLLTAALTLFLCVEWGPLNAERSRWGIASGDPFVKEVVLTFDDGPREHGMQELMAVLGEHGIHATFFLVGKFAERYAPITLSLAAAGHEIANHSYTHPKLYTLWVEKIMREAERCDEVVEALGLRKTRFLRPPGGSFNIKIFNAMRRMGLRLGLWSLNSADYTGRPTEEIVHIVIRSVKPGTVVLMHSGVPNTVTALPQIIRELHAQGYHFVRLEDLWNGGRT